MYEFPDVVTSLREFHMFFCKCWVSGGITNKNLFEQLSHLAAYFMIGELKSTTDPDPKDINSLEFHPIKREELEAAVEAKDDGKLLVLQVASAAALSNKQNKNKKQMIENKCTAQLPAWRGHPRSGP